jgi:hypothetical protein
MMSGNYHVEPISGNYKGVFGKDGEQLCAVYGWKSEERAALIVTALNALEPTKAALLLAHKELMWAYEQDEYAHGAAGLRLAAQECWAALRLAVGEKE